MRLLFLVLFLGVSAGVSAQTLTTAITYQGELEFQGQPAQGTYDFEFLLFDAETSGNLEATLVVEDVPVQAGLFSVELDFGPGVFIGEDRWLELGVRAGASTGGFTGLLPRQTLTPAPFALHAEAVAEDAIGSAQIDDGSIASSDLGSASVGAAAIDQTEVQARVTGTCPVGQAMVSVAEDGQVSCAPLPDGDITGITTSPNSGLTGGCLSGECDLAVNNTVVQARVTAICGIGQALRQINEDGTGACIPVFDGDITGINTSATSGLDGGCSSGTCDLTVDPTEFNSSNPVGYSSITSDVSTGLNSSWVVLDSFFLSAGSLTSGEVLLIGNARVACSNACGSVSGTTCEIGLHDSQSAPPTFATSQVRVGSAAGFSNQTNVGIVRELSLAANTSQTYYLLGRATSAARECVFDYINVGGIFQPD